MKLNRDLLSDTSRFLSLKRIAVSLFCLKINLSYFVWVKYNLQLGSFRPNYNLIVFVAAFEIEASCDWDYPRGRTRCLYFKMRICCDLLELNCNLVYKSWNESSAISSHQHLHLRALVFYFYHNQTRSTSLWQGMFSLHSFLFKNVWSAGLLLCSLYLIVIHSNN